MFQLVNIFPMQWKMVILISEENRTNYLPSTLNETDHELSFNGDCLTTTLTPHLTVTHAYIRKSQHKVKE
jgi:hypothetical protein